MRAIGAALAALAVGSAARAEVFTRVATGDVAAFGTGTIVPNCVNGFALGGGFDSLEEHGLALITFELQPTPSGGQLSAEMRDAGAGASTFKVAVVCSDEEPVLQLAGAPFTATKQATAGGEVVCPLGARAAAGGVAVLGSPDAISVALLAPAFRFEPSGDRLYQQPDGPGPVPFGWSAFVRNESTTISNGADASATCVPFRWNGLATEIASGTAAPGVVTSKQVLCPEGMQAIGGGADAAEPDGLELVASAPAFPGSPVALRLALRADGVAPAPVGWRVGLYNGAATARSFKVAATCVPEASSVRLAVAACLALVLCARRADRRAPLR